MAHQYHHFPSEKDFLHFRKVNQAHWEAFQQNKLTKEQVLSHRFINYFKDYQIEVNGKEADEIFRDELAKAPLKFLIILFKQSNSFNTITVYILLLME